MDRLDLGILREMTRDQFLGFGSFDPRLSTLEVATRLGVDRTTVRDRLEAWERKGFLVGFEVLPNPDLFGVQVVGMAVEVTNILEKARILADLALLEGVIGYISHVGPWVGIGLADDGSGSLERRRKLISRSPGVGQTLAPLEPRKNPATVTPTPLDWRILNAIRQVRGVQLDAVADRVGVSPRTVRRRYERLIRGKALFSVPGLDFTRYTGAVLARLLIHHHPSAGGPEFAKRLAQLFPDSIEKETLPDPAEPDCLVADLLVQFESPAEVETAVEAALALPGVGEVEVFYPRRFEIFPTWFEEQIARVLHQAVGETAGAPRKVAPGGARGGAREG